MQWRGTPKGPNAKTWHTWYAWRPIKTELGMWVWLEDVERKWLWGFWWYRRPGELYDI